MGRVSLRAADAGRVPGGTLRGASLLETVVASAVFLILFALTLGMLPRLAVRDDDGIRIAEAEYRTERAAERYGTGLWPDGEYVERYGWGEVVVRTESCGAFADVQAVTVRARIDGSRRSIVLRRLVERMP